MINGLVRSTHSSTSSRSFYTLPSSHHNIYLLHWSPPTTRITFSQWRRCTLLRRRLTPENRQQSSLRLLQTSRDHHLSCRITRWGYSTTTRRSLFRNLHYPPLLQDSLCVSPPSKPISAVTAGLSFNPSLSLSLTFKSSFIIIIISFYWFFTGIYTMTELHSISCLTITSVQVWWLIRLSCQRSCCFDQFFSRSCVWFSMVL